MSASTQYMSLELELPWIIDQKQEERFQLLLKRIFIAVFLLFIIVPWLPVFDAEYIEPKEKLIKTKVLLNPPEYEKPKPPPKVQPRQVKPVAPVNIKKAPTSGGASSLAALSKQFSSLRGSVDVKRMQNKNVSDNAIGRVRKSDRTVLGQENAVRVSDGIEVDKAMMSVQSATLVSHQSVQVDSPVGNGGAGPVNPRGYQSNLEGRRDMESIRRTFEMQKSNVYALYTRALRNHPDLSGKFLFELIIEPDGSISKLRLVNSELGMTNLERDILARISGINFGAADVNATIVQYKFVFLPS